MPSTLDYADLPEALPANAPMPEFTGPITVLGLIEALLKQPRRLDHLCRDETRQTELLPRFLGIALVSYTIFTLSMLLILNSVPDEAYPRQPLPIPDAHWSDQTGVGLVLAYALGLVGATGICLPTFYFFSLLAGVRMSMLQIVGQLLRAKAAGALMLVGILPIYVAVVLGLSVFHAPADLLKVWLYAGLALPFIAGLQGVVTIFQGIAVMADTLPPERRCRRECFLRRLTFSWAVCYTLVSPVLIYRLWQFISGAA
jgi:hypothetical protein